MADVLSLKGCSRGSVGNLSFKSKHERLKKHLPQNQLAALFWAFYHILLPDLHFVVHLPLLLSGNSHIWGQITEEPV